jgi:hypothetical protein
MMVALVAGWVGYPRDAIAQVSAAAVEVAQTSASTHLLFVDPRLGRDEQDGSSGRSPLRTITRALQLAQPNSVIILAPGTYSADTGEVFPLRVDRQITLQGNPGRQGLGTVIQGSGLYTTVSDGQQAVTIALAGEASIVGVSVMQPEASGYSVWVEHGTPLLMNNSLSPAQSVYISQRSQPTLQDNRMVAARPSAAPAIADPSVANPTPPSTASPPMPSVAVQPSPSLAPAQPTGTVPRVDSSRPIGTAPVTVASPPPAEPGAIAIPVRMPAAAPAPESSVWANPNVQIQAVSPAPIDIPVTPPSRNPAWNAMDQLDQQTPIDIVVTPPPGGWEQPVAAAPSPPSLDLLPVPSMDIPIGNVGGLARVPVAGSGGGYAPSRASLQYRVLVDASPSNVRSRVEALVPGAFPTVVNGRTMMQAGAFSDRANAQELVDLLNSYGFQTQLESR